MSLRSKISAGLLAFLPMITLAQQTFDNAGYFNSIATVFRTVVSTLLPAFIGLILLGFFYGLFIYVRGGAEDQAKGKSIMFWGALAIVVALSIYGIAGLLQTITGANQPLSSPPVQLPV